MPASDVDQAALRRPSSDQSGNEMDELLRCFICFDRVNDAHLCPACSSMCCRDCIVKWLTERKAQCPHCQVELRVEHLVNCRFVQDLTKAVDRLQSSICHSRELCSVHHNELLYYCTNCSQCICADCAMFSLAHSGHTFEKLRVVHERHARLVSAEIANLESRLATLRQVEASIDANIAAVTAAKDDAVYTLQTLAQTMEKSIMQQLKDKLLILESQRNEVSKELSLLESVVHELGCYLDPAICPKSDLIRKSAQLTSMSKAIHEKPLSRLASREPVSDAFHSELIPAFSESSFTIKNFMEAVSLEEVVYSNTLFRNGYNWRLKVYPNGNGGARGTYISVFLELISGLPGPEQIEYAVQMVNHRDASKAITRRFCSKFEVGESWGYNRFFLIDVLVRDGYLSEDDCLFLKFFVRPPSMHLANLEQQKYIFALERVQTRYEQTIRDLKKRIGLRNDSFDSAIYRNKDDTLLFDDDHAEQDDESDLDSGTREFCDSHIEQQSETEYSETSAGNLNEEALAEHEDLGEECVGEDEGVGVCEPEYDFGHSRSDQEERSNAMPTPSSWNGEDEEYENIPELDNIQRLDISNEVR